MAHNSVHCQQCDISGSSSEVTGSLKVRYVKFK